MKIALMGAGAVGCYVIMGLQDKFGDDFMLVAEGERKERLEKKGLRINQRTYYPRVVSPKEAGRENLDYLIVAVKYTALSDSLDDIQEAVFDNTAVVSLINGVDSEEIIGRKIGMEHMLYAFIKIASSRKGNEVTFTLPDEKTGIFVGELTSSAYAPFSDQRRAKGFQTLFDGTAVHCHVKEDILVWMWDKFGVNIARNLPQAVLGVGIGVYEDSTYIADLSRKLRKEIVDLAAAKGIVIPQEYFVAPAGKEQRYSTLQDLDAGRKTEIEMFSGAAVRMAKEVGVSCPYNEVIYDLIKALEEKNEGKFNY